MKQWAYVALFSWSLCACTYSLVEHADPHIIQEIPIALKEPRMLAQPKNQCGATALAVALNHLGDVIDTENVIPMVYTPGKDGALPQDMISAARRLGYIPVMVGDFETVTRLVKQDCPVIVLLDISTSLVNRLHYAVVLGYDPRDEKVYLSQDENNIAVMDKQQFLSDWSKTKHWGFTPSPTAKTKRNKRFDMAQSSCQ